MNGELFREWVGGRRHDLPAALFRLITGILEFPYYAVTSLRNGCYDTGLLKSYRAPIPIVSVGNLTLGGTGKSPLVAWLARFFLDRGIRPGLISRGFGRIDQGGNDEFLELAFRLPSVPHLQNPDRVAATKEFLRLRNSEAVDLLILDDALQHRRMARDLDIVLLDATEPFGFEHVFPRGTLRESIRGLRRAGVVLLSRADLISPEEREAIKNRVLDIAPDVVWGEIEHVPEKMISLSGVESDVTELSGKNVFAFCGIGNPAAFRNTLNRCGAEVVELAAFPDHHHYTVEELDRLIESAASSGVDRILCTMKDLVKIDQTRFAETSLTALAIQIRFLSGEDAFRTRLAGASTTPALKVRATDSV